MKDEIKEILDKLKDGNWYDELDLTGTMWIELRWEETHLLLDYITNLRKENKRLKHNLEQMYNDTKDTYNEICAEQIDIINELEKSAKEIVRVGKNKGYQYVENLNELKTKEEIYDFIEFYYGLYLLEQLDKLKELKEGK